MNNCVIFLSMKSALTCDTDNTAQSWGVHHVMYALQAAQLGHQGVLTLTDVDSKQTLIRSQQQHLKKEQTMIIDKY